MKLSENFTSSNQDLSVFMQGYWHAWQEIRQELDDYVLYYADNILQMQKSQIGARLDRRLQGKVYLAWISDEDEADDVGRSLVALRHPASKDKRQNTKHGKHQYMSSGIKA